MNSVGNKGRHPWLWPTKEKKCTLKAKNAQLEQYFAANLCPSQAILQYKTWYDNVLPSSCGQFVFSYAYGESHSECKAEANLLKLIDDIYEIG